jgi:uncharacterized membrane protein YuzA (DUF378 family)
VKILGIALAAAVVTFIVVGLACVIVLMVANTLESL